MKNSLDVNDFLNIGTHNFRMKKELARGDIKAYIEPLH